MRYKTRKVLFAVFFFLSEIFSYVVSEQIKQKNYYFFDLNCTFALVNVVVGNFARRYKRTDLCESSLMPHT